MIPKSRIRLSRSLRSQITPYPNIGKAIKRSALIIGVILLIGLFFFNKNEARPPVSSPDKQILGEKEEAQNEPGHAVYKVKKGDTLFNLSQKYNVSWQTLAEINNLSEPYVLRIGQLIKVPIFSVKD